MTPSKTPETIAKELLRQCAAKALHRLRHPEADVETIRRQLEQTARLLAPRRVRKRGT